MKPLPVFWTPPCMIPDMSSCKLFWNQKAPDDTRWVTLLDLCCQCKWLTSTVLFLQGLHPRKYTTSRLDISFCLISFVLLRTFASAGCAFYWSSVLWKVALQQLLSHCRCCSHWFPWRYCLAEFFLTISSSVCWTVVHVSLKVKVRDFAHPVVHIPPSQMAICFI